VPHLTFQAQNNPGRLGGLGLDLLLLGLLQEGVGQPHRDEREAEDGDQQEVVHAHVGGVVRGLAEGEPAILVHQAVVVHEAVVEPGVGGRVAEAVARDVVAQHVALVLVHNVLGNEGAVPGLVLGVDVGVDDLHLQQQLAHHHRRREVQVDPLVQLEVVEHHVEHHPHGGEVHQEVDDQARGKGVHQGGVVTVHREGGVVHHVAVEVVQVVLVVGQQVEQAALVPRQHGHRNYRYEALHLASEQLPQEQVRGDSSVQENNPVKDVELRSARLVYVDKMILDRNTSQVLTGSVSALIKVLPQRMNIPVLGRAQSHEIHQTCGIHIEGLKALPQKIESTNNKRIKDAVRQQTRSGGSKVHHLRRQLLDNGRTEQR
jgi:hypothetical protein